MKDSLHKAMEDAITQLQDALGWRNLYLRWRHRELSGEELELCETGLIGRPLAEFDNRVLYCSKTVAAIGESLRSATNETEYRIIEGGRRT